MDKVIRINGLGSVSEGNYDDIDVSGSCSFNGKVSSKKIIVDGTVSSKEEIVSDYLEVNGYLSNKGNYNIKKGIINGYIKNKGDIGGEDLIINGSLFSRSMEFNDVKVNGKLVIINNCQSENFYCNGKLNIGGLLSSDKIEILIKYYSRVKQIGGDTLVVKKEDNKFSGKMLFFRKYYLEVEEIEADNIYLEYTKCEVVRGRNITIGKGCNIKRIEYLDEVLIDSNSKVKEKIKG